MVIEDVAVVLLDGAIIEEEECTVIDDVAVVSAVLLGIAVVELVVVIVALVAEEFVALAPADVAVEPHAASRSDRVVAPATNGMVKQDNLSRLFCCNTCGNHTSLHFKGSVGDGA